jgi:ATP-binding cassette subfamily F protein uup
MKGVDYSLPKTGRQLIKDFTFEFLPGERLGIAGPNGVGKSTLLDLVTGGCGAPAGAGGSGGAARAGLAHALAV